MPALGCMRHQIVALVERAALEPHAIADDGDRTINGKRNSGRLGLRSIRSSSPERQAPMRSACFSGPSSSRVLRGALL